MYILSSLPDCLSHVHRHMSIFTCCLSLSHIHSKESSITGLVTLFFFQRLCRIHGPLLKRRRLCPGSSLGEAGTRLSRVIAGAASPCQKATAAQRERWSRRESVVPRRFVAVCNQKRVQKVVIESPSLLMGPSVSGHLGQTLQSAG